MPILLSGSCANNGRIFCAKGTVDSWISTQDAQSRGIQNGDKVRVFNDRGETVIRAYVTERIMPGVVSLGEGAWYRPDEKGRDQGGCPNVLTRDHYSPGGAWPYNTNLVQVGKYVSDT